MFCVKCGKQVSDDMMFCPVCGTAVVRENEGENMEEKPSYIDKNDNVRDNGKTTGTKRDNEEQVLEKSVRVTKNYEKIKKVGDSFVKRQKMWRFLNKVIIVILAIILIKESYNTLIGILDGATGFYELIKTAATMLLIVVIPVACVSEFIDRTMRNKKEQVVLDCIELLQVDDNNSLVQELNAMNSVVIKRAYMDERGNASINGKYCNHSFVFTDGVLTLVSEKDNYKCTLERESILLCLIKHLDSAAPVNAYEMEKKNQRTRYRLPVRIALIILGIFLLILPEVVPGLNVGGNQYIEVVQKACPKAYKNITYKEAFDDFFANPDWKYFVSSDNRNIVEFNGKCTYDDEEADVRIQFELFLDEGTMEMKAMSLNGENQNKLFMGVFMMKVFESYKE